VRSLVDERLVLEARRFRLRFACGDCAHFAPSVALDDAGERGVCSQGFPAEEHRDPRLEGRAEVVFCKMFEAS
jgi:hypothetical protein